MYDRFFALSHILIDHKSCWIQTEGPFMLFEVSKSAMLRVQLYISLYFFNVVRYHQLFVHQSGLLQWCKI